MDGIVVESYPVKLVALGSLNGRPHQYFKLPVDEEAARLRYAHRYIPREGGPSNTVVRSFSQYGLVDKTHLTRVNGGEHMPIIIVPRAQARRVKQYDVMVVPTGGSNGIGLVFVKEELLGDKRTHKELTRLSIELYDFLGSRSSNGYQEL